jgi:tetratricopeptide (TPR) repeat protein
MRPFTAAQDPTRPFLSPFLLRGFFAASLATGATPFVDRYGLRAALESGSPIPSQLAQLCWIGIEIALLVALVALARLLLPGRAALWHVLPAALVAVSSAASSGVTRLDEGVLAAVFLLLAWTGLEGSRGIWRVLGVGILAGLAVAATPSALVFVPMLLMRVAWEGREGRFGSVLVVAVAVLMGFLLGEPRLVETPGAVLSRVVAHFARERSMATAPVLRQLVDGLSVGVLAMAVLSVGVFRGATARRRLQLLALWLPFAVLLRPAAGLSDVLLLAPCASLLATIGLAHLPRRWPRFVPAAAALLLLAEPAVGALSDVGRARHGDSRLAAARWIDDHLPLDARIVSDLYGPSLRPERITFTLPFDARDPARVAAAYDLRWYEGFDTFILVGSFDERYQVAPERFRAALAFRQLVRTRCEPAALFAEDYLGPVVEVWRRRIELPRGGIEEILAQGIPAILPEFYIGLGGSYLRMGRTDEALRLLEAIRPALPEDPRLALNLGGAYLAKDDLMKAGDVLREAVHAHPDHALLRYQLGRVRERQRLFGDAIAEYKMAVRANPAYAEAHLGLAYAYAGAGNRSAALGAARRAIELSAPGSVRDQAASVVAELEGVSR